MEPSQFGIGMGARAESGKPSRVEGMPRMEAIMESWGEAQDGGMEGRPRMEAIMESWGGGPSRRNHGGQGGDRETLQERRRLQEREYYKRGTYYKRGKDLKRGKDYKRGKAYKRGKITFFLQTTSSGQLELSVRASPHFRGQREKELLEQLPMTTTTSEQPFAHLGHHLGSFCFSSLGGLWV